MLSRNKQGMVSKSCPSRSHSDGLEESRYLAPITATFPLKINRSMRTYMSPGAVTNAARVDVSFLGPSASWYPPFIPSTSSSSSPARCMEKLTPKE